MNEPQATICCTLCRERVTAFFTLDARAAVCQPCAQRATGEIELSPERRILGAVALGALAIPLGALVPALVFTLTEGVSLWIGLFVFMGVVTGVAVGALVGGAIRTGAGGRGARAYQILAVALTLAAIAYGAVGTALLRRVLSMDHATARVAILFAAIHTIPVYVQVVWNTQLLFIVSLVGGLTAWKQTRPSPIVLRGPFAVQGQRTGESTEMPSGSAPAAGVVAPDAPPREVTHAVDEKAPQKAE